MLRNEVRYRLLAYFLVFIACAGSLEAAASDGTTLTGKILTAEGAPISGATILVMETRRSTTTARNGEYLLRMQPGQYTLFATAPGYGVDQRRVDLPLAGIGGVDFRLISDTTRFGDELVVIGSRAARTALETPVPVDSFSADEIAASGRAETSKILQFLAPSFNVSTSTISDGTDILRPATLRGLGPDQTLVLINGKRRHPSALVHVNGSVGRGSAGVDLNAIPASAIDRIEILRDGAAAQYGSDAIAGVINIILRSDVGTRVRSSFGETYDGDGDTWNLSVNHGWRIGESGFVNTTVEYRDRGRTNRAGEDPRRIYNFLEQPFGQPELTEGTLDPREQDYDRLNHRYGDADSRNVHFFLNSSIPVSASVEMWLFGDFSLRDGRSAGFNRLPRESRTNVLIHPDGHLPLIQTDVEDFSFSGGIRKNFSRWSLEIGATTGGNLFRFSVGDSANTSLGTASPTDAEAGALRFEHAVVNVDLFGTIGEFDLAFGIEHRTDRYSITAGEPASYINGGEIDQFGGPGPAGIQVFPGFRPSDEIDASRDSFGAYGEVEWRIDERWLLASALRFEDFSDGFSNLSGKAALRYFLTERIVLRGAVSTGFRAPSLHQSSLRNTSTQFVLIGDELRPLEVGTFRHGSEVVEAFGIPALREETSLSLSAGWTWRILDNLTLTADVFHLEIDDRIVLSGQFRASNPEIAPILEPFGVAAAQMFTNAIDTETQGFDLVAEWFRTFGGGQSLAVTAAAHWNRTEAVGTVRTPPELEDFGETIFDRVQRTFLERGQPREIYHLGARYSAGPYDLLARLSGFGSVTTAESSTDPSLDQEFGGRWLTDIEASYRLSSGLKITLGAENLFDVYPERNRPELSFHGIFPYPRRAAPFGFNGGSYFVRLSYDL